MEFNLRFLLMILGLVLIFIILSLVSKNKLPIKYSLFWLLSACSILLVGVAPDFVNLFTSFIGFETTSSMVTGIIIGLLLLITLLLTIIISEQKRKITLLIQEVSIIKEKINK